MATAYLSVQINNFVPIGQPGCTSATLALTSTIPAQPPTWLTLSSNNIVVTQPESGGVSLSFELNDPNYVLIGAAFTPSPDGVGRAEFPQINVNRTQTNSTMVITDDDVPQTGSNSYTYVILVQRVSDGQIGIIDPGIENDF